jgi:hypothetical protein
MLMDEPKETSADEQRPQKKPYQKPVLIRLGTQRELTRTTGHDGRADGGLVGMNRTGRGSHHDLIQELASYLTFEGASHDRSDLPATTGGRPTAHEARAFDLLCIHPSRGARSDAATTPVAERCGTMIPKAEMVTLLEWAKARLANGEEPPWRWYQLMKLRETLEAILIGTAAAGAFTTTGSPSGKASPTAHPPANNSNLNGD